MSDTMQIARISKRMPPMRPRKNGGETAKLLFAIRDLQPFQHIVTPLPPTSVSGLVRCARILLDRRLKTTISENGGTIITRFK